MTAHEASARPRVGLLGNPSDLYGGHVLGFTFDDFAARARIEPAPRTRLVGPGGEEAGADDLAQLRPAGLGGGCQLLAAALRRLATVAPDRVDPRARPFRLSTSTDIPRQVGLAGSSALVIAALRALAAWFEVPLDPFALSELALAAEAVELSTVAGPQDRVLQAYGGALFMDFREPRAAERYLRLDPTCLPPLFLAWDPSPGESSGAVHSDVRARWEAGDPQVRAAIGTFPGLADEGLERLRAGDGAALAGLLDGAFDTRASLFPIQAGDRERVTIARAHAAGASLCGSGGAVVGVPREPAAMDALRAAYEAAGHRFLRPCVGAPAA
jgi:mevalonate kinase